MKSLIDSSTRIFDIGGLFHKPMPEGGETELIEKWVGKDGNAELKKVPVNGCSYNFNRTTDMLCFKNAVARFVRTGAKEDAFDVYFCYSEFFKTFGGYKRGIDDLLDLLFQHESTSATLLTRHRDHYSHSVYVFALGLAIFMNNKHVRSAFARLYGEDELYEKFLKYWGIAGLFHDIGYPFEIAFNQIREYTCKIDKDGEKIKLRYDNLDAVLHLSADEIDKCGEFLPKGKEDINSIFASEILKTFGAISGNPELDVKIVEDCLKERIVSAEKYMDHGYFSAVLFLKKLLDTENFKLDRPTVDALTAILYHNSFYKRTYKEELRGGNCGKLKIGEHPLAFLLMLCDELQCWDRMPYGEESKKVELAWDTDVYVSDRHIEVIYYFQSVGDGTNNDDGKAEEEKKEYCDAAVGKVIKTIDELLDTDSVGKFTLTADFKKKDKKVYDHFSDSKFIDLCKIAETINISYMKDCEKAGIKSYMQQEFDNLTLELKMSNIAQAKNYVRHLDDINCFFSDRILDYPPVTEFTEDEVEFLTVNEHCRWVSEKVSMGWKYGTDYTDREDRARKRIHSDIVPYHFLTADEKNKDYFPVNNIIRNLNAYGIKVYRLKYEKPSYVLGCTGHCDLSRIKHFDEEKVRSEVRKYLRELKEQYSLKLFCGYASGADLLFADEALKCGIDIIAVLPCEWKEFISEHDDGGVRFMQLLAQAKEVRVKPNNISRYSEMSRYIVRQCQEMLVLWDGQPIPLKDDEGREINKGGTYDTMLAAERAGRVIKRF